MSTRKPRLPTESDEQRKFVQWFRLQYRVVRIFAIPNGGGRSKAQAGILKAEGVEAGVPDLCVPAGIDGSGVPTWVEMKRTKDGRISDAQKDWHAYLRGLGHTVLVCAGFAEARRMVGEIKAR
ncbi:MAG TPA: VRR-NUC domain-containing protein [Polyangiaceae bacterium]